MFADKTQGKNVLVRKCYHEYTADTKHKKLREKYSSKN